MPDFLFNVQNFFNNHFSIIVIGLVGILVIWNLILQIQFSKTKKRLNKIFEGKNASDLEDVLSKAVKRLKTSEENIQEIHKFLRYLNKKTKKSIQKVGIVRFNPFQESGGDQSFAIAFLDAYNNGLIISSLYTRQGVSVYSKPIETGKSIKYPLSDEEQKALKKAKG